MIRALVVDDEPPARRRLTTLLRDHADVEVTGECGTVADAVEALGSWPDVVFLDVDLPGGDGFGLLEALGAEPRPAVVFVTAHQQHAVRAFDVAAIDYLLKPFDAERLALALDRVRAARPIDDSPAAPLTRLPVSVGGRIRFVELTAVDLIKAERNYARVYAGDRTFVVRSTLNALQQRLGTADFVRVHRSTIVRLDRISEVETLPHGELALRLRGGQQVLSGRQYTAPLRTALGL